MEERLVEIMKTYALSPSKFADELGVQRSGISHILSGRNKPSYDLLMKIINKFEEINIEWLMTGKGTIKKENEPSQTQLYSEKNKNIKNNSLFEVNNTDDGKKVDYRQEIKTEFTNVNNVDFVLLFYKNGTFERYNPRN